jgi:superfamily II DNA or RNA helicase
MSSPKRKENVKSFLAQKLYEEEVLKKENVEEIVLGPQEDFPTIKGPVSAPLNKVEKIVLRENQAPHIAHLKKIFNSHYFAFDMSTMGAGKTYTTTQLALDLNFKHVIIVCPVSVENKWGTMRKYGINIDYIISYNSLRSVKNKTPKHGLLERYDLEDGSTIFTPTERLNAMIKAGCLVVLDECQHVKNKNDQFLAAQAIAKAIGRSSSESRFLMLSGTPIDKEVHAIHLLQLMYIIYSSRLYVYSKEEYVLRLYGAKDLVDYCEKFIDSKAITKFVKEHPWRPDNVENNCYQIFQYIVKPALTSAMPSPPLEIDCKNGYYDIKLEADRKALMKGIAELHSSVRFDEGKGKVEITRDTFGSINKALAKIESAKINTMVRVVKDILEDDANVKIGIFVNFTESLNRLQDLLKKYKPIRLDGGVHKNKRQILIDEFQEPNAKRRVIIANIQVASTGIDLDDKYGGFPRFAFASPNYKILDLHQLTRRFVRLDSKSNASFRFFYGKGLNKENSILNALARKTNIMKDTLEGQVEEGIVFPGDYEDEIEIN